MIGRWQHPPVESPNITHQDEWAQWRAERADPASLRPPLLTVEEYKALADEDRDDYDEARKIACSNLPMKDTPMNREVGLAFQLLAARNAYDGKPGVRMGMFLSGSSGGLGKSTLARELAARFEESLRARPEVFNPPDSNRDLWIPVVYVGLPTNVTVKGLCRTLLHFYGEAMPKAATETELASAVRELVHDCGTQLVVIDDITRLRMERESHQDAADAIRELQESAATIVGVGIDIASSGLLFERGRKGSRAANLKTQTRRRFKLKHLRPFDYGSDEAAAAWGAHLAAVEEDVLLLHAQPGDLVDLAEYLYDRTQGFLGSLNELLGEACLLAIITGQERLTEELLDQVELDEAADNDDEDEPTDAVHVEARAARTRDEKVLDRQAKTASPHRKRKKNGAWNGDNPDNRRSA